MSESLIQMQRKLADVTAKLDAEIAEAVARSAVTPTEAPADYRAADFHRALVLPGSIDHSADKRRRKK